jgi:hypothetical protein
MSSRVVESSQLQCRGRGGDLAKADIVAPGPEAMIASLPEAMIAQETLLKPKPCSVETAKASANKAAKKRKRKREKKPYRRNKKPLDMPKRPLSAYNFFFREQREVILDERDREEEAAEASGINASSATGRSLFESMGKDIASRWKTLSEQGHEKYTKLAEEDTERYKTEMADYSNTQKAILRLAIDKESQQEKAKSPPTTPTWEDTGPAQNHPQLKEGVALPPKNGLSHPQPNHDAAFSLTTGLAAYHASQHQQEKSQVPGGSPHGGASGLQLHHPSLYPPHQGSLQARLPADMGSMHAQVNLQNQILAEELATQQTRLLQGRLLEAKLARIHQQGSYPQYQPSGLSHLVHYNGAYPQAPAPGFYAAGNNLGQDCSLGHGAHQGGSRFAPPLLPPYQSESLQNEYLHYLRR